MKSTIKQIFGLALMAGVLLVGCSGGSEKGDNQSSVKASATKESGGLSAFEQENGIGPVTEKVSLDDIDMEKVEMGEKLFKMKCSACHKIGERYVGPDLGEVLERRTPTYVMNMVLNPGEMVKKHPEAKKLLAEFMTPMPDQGLNQEEAQAIVKYLASVQEEEHDDD